MPCRGLKSAKSAAFVFVPRWKFCADGWFFHPSALINSRNGRTAKLAALPFSNQMTPVTPISTLNDLFSRVAAAANPRAVLWQDEFGQWQPISSDQIYQRVRALAQAFLGWGAKKGDRIALIAKTAGSGRSRISPRWPLARWMCRSIPHLPASRSRRWCGTPAAALPWSQPASNSTS